MVNITTRVPELFLCFKEMPSTLHLAMKATCARGNKIKNKDLCNLLCQVERPAVTRLHEDAGQGQSKLRKYQVQKKRHFKRENSYFCSLNCGGTLETENTKVEF